MNIIVNNKGLIAIGAWSLVVALILATTCRAGDGTATGSVAVDSSSPSTAAPAASRPRIPPPRVWIQAPKPIPGGQARDTAKVNVSTPAPKAALSPALDSSRAPAAAANQPATRRSQASNAPSESTPPETAASPSVQSEEPGSERISSSTAPVPSPVAAGSDEEPPLASGPTPGPSLSRQQDTDPTAALGRCRGTRKSPGGSPGD